MNEPETEPATVPRTCAACGAHRLTSVVRIVADRVRGGGREHCYGLCADCGPAEELGNLDAAVARDVLSLDVDDPVLDHIKVPRFCDLRLSTPDSPSVRPWAHLNAEALACQVAEWRDDHTERSGGPCSFCGIGTTPPETKWRAWRLNNEALVICGRCQVHMGAQLSNPDEARRDAAAVVLAGLVYRNRVAYRPGIGRQLGITFYKETGRSKPNPTPWAHVDVRQVRAHLVELFDAHALKRPAWWRADRVVEW